MYYYTHKYYANKANYINRNVNVFHVIRLDFFVDRSVIAVKDNSARFVVECCHVEQFEEGVAEFEAGAVIEVIGEF